MCNINTIGSKIFILKRQFTLIKTTATDRVAKDNVGRSVKGGIFLGGIKQTQLSEGRCKNAGAL